LKAAETEPTDAAAKAAKPTVVTVERGPFRRTLEAEAVLVPAHASALSIQPERYEGKLRVVSVVGHGEAVKQGEVVLRLDDEQISEAVRQAEWTVRTEELNLHKERLQHEEWESRSRFELEEVEKNLHFARRKLDGYREVQLPLNRRDEAAQVRAYLHRITDQEEEIAQLGKMYKEDELTEETEEIVLERAKRQLEEVRESLERFRARRAFLHEFEEPRTLHGLEHAVEQAERKLRDAEREKRAGGELQRIRVEQAEGRLARARKKLEGLQRDLAAFALKSPMDGVVLHGDFVSTTAPDGTTGSKPTLKPLRAGDVAQPRQVILSVASAGALVAQFHVAPKDRYVLKAGMAATLLPSALPGVALAASVGRLGKFQRSDGTWRVHAVFGHDDPRLFPQLEAGVRILLVDLPDALLLPSEALVAEGARWQCWVQDDSPFGLSARTVVPGPSDGKMTVIREGLREGDKVLIEGKAE